MGFTKEVTCHCLGGNLSFLLFVGTLFLRAGALERGAELSCVGPMDERVADRGGAW